MKKSITDGVSMITGTHVECEFGNKITIEVDGDKLVGIKTPKRDWDVTVNEAGELILDGFNVNKTFRNDNLLDNFSYWPVK